MLDIACNNEQASNMWKQPDNLQLRLKDARAGLSISTLLILATPQLPKKKEAAKRAVISLWDFSVDSESPGRLASHPFFFLYYIY